MGLRRSDFELADGELSRINAHFRARAEAHAAEGEGAPSGVSVTFDFIPGLGRVVTARFDGEVAGKVVSGI